MPGLTPAQFFVPFGTMALVLSLKGTGEVPFSDNTRAIRAGR